MRLTDGLLMLIIYAVCLGSVAGMALWLFARALIARRRKSA